MGGDASDFSTGNKIGHNHHEHGALSPSAIGILSAFELCTMSPRPIQHVHDGFDKVPYFFNGRLLRTRYYAN